MIKKKKIMGWFSSEENTNTVVNVTEHVSAIALVILAITAVIYVLAKFISKHMQRTAATAANREVRLNNITATLPQIAASVTN